MFLANSTDGQDTFSKRFHFGFPAMYYSGIVVTDSCYYVSGIVADSIYPYTLGVACSPYRAHHATLFSS